MIALYNLAVLALEVLFFFGVVSLAFWQRRIILYFFAAGLSLSIGLYWLQSRATAQYMLIFGIAAFAMCFLILLMATIDAIQKRIRL